MRVLFRSGRASIQDAYAAEQGGEIWLINCHIPEYHGANRFNHEPRRQRKLLLKHKEIDKMIGARKSGGVTLEPPSIYFNERGRAKVKIERASGKKQDRKSVEEGTGG